MLTIPFPKTAFQVNGGFIGVLGKVHTICTRYSKFVQLFELLFGLLGIVLHTLLDLQGKFMPYGFQKDLASFLSSYDGWSSIIPFFVLLCKSLLSMVM